MRRVSRSSTLYGFHDATGAHRLDGVEAEPPANTDRRTRQGAFGIGQEVELQSSAAFSVR